MTEGHKALGIWRHARDLMLEAVKAGDVIADLGCGKFRWKLGRCETIHRIDKDAFCAPDVVWDLNKLPYPFDDDVFNGAFAMEVIEHLENPFLFLREVCRITKDWIVITSPDPDLPLGRVWLSELHYREHQHIMWVPKHLIEIFCITRGFKVVETRVSDSSVNYIMRLGRFGAWDGCERYC